MTEVKLYLVDGTEVMMDKDEFLNMPFDELMKKLNGKKIKNVDFYED